MHEAVLRDYFAGLLDAEQLRFDLEGSASQTSSDTTHYRIVDMETEFQVFPEHLTKLCDSVLDGKITASSLKEIGFCLIASDNFHWDVDTDGGEAVAQTLQEWASPAI